jgi:hypothetical protein
MFIDGAGARLGQHQDSGECTRQLSADQRDKIAAALMRAKHDPTFGVNAGFLALLASMTTAVVASLLTRSVQQKDTVAVSHR